MGKESDSHKKAEQLVKSHPKLSFHKALQIEKQRQEAKMKRDEDGTVAVWNNMSIEEDLEQYLKEFYEIDNWSVQKIEECVEEILDLEIFGEEKENRNDDAGKTQRALRMRDVNSNIQKE
ncbi:hypothetical protein GCK72_012615 [Caenorhabditis remanei]|uniref:Uncharacterized protein n=1 Tax=Caenorhabditis remanei TaxID=31234 RepID=A0A6A5GP25_CAERE|nr:hypothetical protein GCK72_012615 [Caenorhabditis remanei]KAF1756162.1 hypothetical protein GCK72_012615 [Caenorhabditis remanei]